AGFSGAVTMPLIVQAVGWSDHPQIDVLTQTNDGSWSPSRISASWSVDFVPPHTVANQPGGYDGHGLVTLTSTEPAAIFYTTDGTDPTVASSPYIGPIALPDASVLKYFGVDAVGNQESVQTYGPPVHTVQVGVVDSSATTITFASEAFGGTGSS